jgi:hypothetical protein
MGNQQSTSATSSTRTATKTSEENKGTTATATTRNEVKKLPATSIIPFQQLSPSSFRIQELFVESRYCRYLRDVMSTLHYSPDQIKRQLTNEDIQSLYALYWSCLLSAMDRELNTCLPASSQIDKMASDYMFLKASLNQANNNQQKKELETALKNLMNPIVKCHNKFSSRYEMFLQRHFEATDKLNKSTLDKAFLPMIERSQKDKLYIPAPDKDVAATQNENIQKQLIEKKEILEKYQLVKEKYCAPVPPDDKNKETENEKQLAPREFEWYYRHRMCIIAHLCAPDIKACVDKEKKSVLDCMNGSPIVNNNCLNRIIKSGIEI